MKIAIMGAGGKMGCRITDSLAKAPQYDVMHVEIGVEAVARLCDRGIEPVAQEQALPVADVVILAIPDILIGRISEEVVPQMKSGSMLVCLDPAAAYAGVIKHRDDITCFINHPCHPPLLGDETEPEAQQDWFGGKAKQDVVCAIHSGDESLYGAGEQLARAMWAPVRDTYRITVEQMAILEPALVESLTTTLITAMKEGLDRVVEMGVPREAAESFLMGHLKVEFGVIFGYAGFPFSDGAKHAMNAARQYILKPDYLEKILNIDRVRQSVAEITGIATTV